MRSKSNKKKKIIIAVCAGIIAAFGIFSSVNKKDAMIDKLSQELNTQKAQLANISQNISGSINDISANKAVIAKKDIPAGTIINNEIIEEKHFEQALIPSDANKNLYSLIGKVAAKDIKSGEFVKKADIMENNYNGLDLPSGMRAITIPVSYLQGLGSYMSKGSRVDIISTTKTDSSKPQVILQDVKIISLEGVSDGDNQPATKATSITFQIPAELSANIVDAMMSGKLQIVARNLTDRVKVKSSTTSTKNRNKTVSSIKNVSNFTLPEIPAITGIPSSSMSGLPSPAMPSLAPTKKVELIQANVKSEVTFDSDY